MPKDFRLTASSLRWLAMTTMLIDHIGHTLYPDQLWLRYIGRLAFPLFAFLISQGYRHTRHFPKYLTRLLLLALITDLPFHFMSHRSWDYLPFQNVIWTFIIGLIVIWAIDQTRTKLPPVASYLISGLIFLAGYQLAGWLDPDYHRLGVTTVVGFYLFSGHSRAAKLKQLGLMVLVNLILANIFRLDFLTPDNVQLYWQHYGWELISPQYWALLALPLIWSYTGQAGYQSKATQVLNYLFYPLHMLILGFLAAGLS